MKLVEYQKCIIENNLPKYSIFYGEEQLIIDKYVDKIVELGYELSYVDSVSDCISTLTSNSLFDTQKVIVVSNDDNFRSAESSWDKIIDYTNSSNHILILRYWTLKKNTKFYKHHTKQLVEFNYVQPEIFENYIHQLLPKLKNKNIEILKNICENSYGHLLLEANKINAMASLSSYTVNRAFETLLEDNMFATKENFEIFDLTNAVVYGDIEKSCKYLKLVDDTEENVFGIATLLYNSFLNMLSYQGMGKDKSNATVRTGLTDKQLWAVKKNIGGYSNKELLRNIIACKDIGYRVRTGQYPSGLALRTLIMRCIN